MTLQYKAHNQTLETQGEVASKPLQRIYSSILMEIDSCREHNELNYEVRSFSHSF